MTIQDAIKGDKHVPIRRLYIKRRLFPDAEYEPNWVRVDVIDGIQRVKSWGTPSNEIDYSPGQLGGAGISDVTLSLDNSEGHWNYEKDSRSLFAPYDTYLGRRSSRLKIEAAYIDETGNEIGTSTIFEGLIDRVTIGDDQFARVNALNYATVFTQHDISEIAPLLTKGMLVSDVVSAIFTVVNISQYLTLSTNAPANNEAVADVNLLEGSFWQVLQKLSFLSASTIIIDVNNFYFKPRDTDNTDAWIFYGAGNRFPDILKITRYDDEGADRVRLVFTDSETGLKEESVSQTLTYRYAKTPQSVDLSIFGTNTAILKNVLKSLVSYWQFPRPSITFLTKMMLDRVKVGDQIRIDVRLSSAILSSDGTYWGNFQWGQRDWQENTTSLLKKKGAILIKPSLKWMVTKIEHNLDNWTSSITAEVVKDWRNY